MLAIGRALLLEPKLLVMDEPTEGLAPMIVEQVVEALRGLAAESEIAVLLIEQNLGVAIDVADRDRRDGQRPHRARDGGAPSSAPTASCRSGCSACARARRRRPPRRAAPPRRRRGADAGVHGAARPWRRRAVARRHRAAHACAASTAGTPAAPRGRSPTSRAASPLALGGRRQGAACARRASRHAQASPAHRRAGSAQVFDFPVAASSGARRLRRRHLRHQGPRAVLPAPVPREARPARRHGRPRDLRQAVDRGGPSARGRAPPSRGRSGGLQRRPRQRRDGDGARLRRASSQTRGDLGGLISRRRLGRHLAGDQRHARAAGRRAQGDGLDDGQRRHAALCRPERHLHDVFGHRRAGHPSHQRAGARQRGACAGRNDGAPAGGLGDQQAGARPDDVRRDDAVRAGRRQAPRGRLRLPRLPRHRRRRPVDGKARRLGPARRRDRRLDDRDRRRDRRRRALRRADAARRLRAPRRCPTSARAARSTWSTSAPGTRCPSASRAASSTATTRP